LDFQYSGGLYRGVSLIITNPVHISEPLSAGITAGGGVFVTFENVSAQRADVHVKAHVVNDSNIPARRCKVITNIFDHKNAVVACRQSESVMIAGGQGHEFVTTLGVVKPMLWHPDNPYLRNNSGP
jgi:beta-galactosidase